MSKQHKVTVTVELEDRTIIQKVEGFNSSNPIWHAEEFTQAAGKASFFVETALSGMYGDVRERAS